jgi:hypothetical protein
MRTPSFLLCLLLSLLTVSTLTGCGSFAFFEGGSLTLASQGEEDRLTLAGRFDRAIYGHDAQDNLTVVLFEGPPAEPTQAAVIRMFWLPRAGKTPVAESATNAQVHYVVFAGQAEPRDVGVYSGGGFVYPKSDPGQSSLRLALWEASVQLADRSDGFEDLLGQSVMAGEVTAYRNQHRVSQLLHQLNIEVNQSLGYPRLVERPLPNPLTANRFAAR